MDFVTFCKTAWHSLGTSSWMLFLCPWCLQDRACHAQACKLFLTASCSLAKPFPSQNTCLWSPKGLQMLCCPKGQTQTDALSDLWCSQGNVVAGTDWRTVCWVALVEIGSCVRNVQRAELLLSTWWCFALLGLYSRITEFIMTLSIKFKRLWIRPYIHIFNLELFGILNSIFMFLILFLDTGGIISAEPCQKCVRPPS